MGDWFIIRSWKPMLYDTRWLGLICAIVMIGLIIATPTKATTGNLLVDGGFETAGTRPIGSTPAFGLWDSDEATRTGVDRGITPAEASLMLRFDATNNSGPGSNVACDLDQIVDLSSYTGLLAGGN